MSGSLAGYGLGTPELPLQPALGGTGRGDVAGVVYQLLSTLAVSVHIPDNTATGGNARGANAVDLQTTRAAATQVASGGNSGVLSGGNNAAVNVYAVVAGGVLNIANGHRSAVLGGENNVANNGFSAVLGGQSNSAIGLGTWIVGGLQANTRGHYGRGAWASGQFALSGDAEAGEYVLRRQTTDATVTRLTADAAAAGTANTVNLPNNGTYRVKMLAVATQYAGSSGTAGDCASWEVDVLVKRGANVAATSIVGLRVGTASGYAAGTAGTAFAPDFADAAAAAWRLTIAADTTNGGPAVSGTGENNKSIQWVTRVLDVETAR